MAADDRAPKGAPARGDLVALSLDVALSVAAARTSAAWYRDALGFSIDREFERDGTLIAIRLRAGAIQILLSQDDGAKGMNRAKGEGFSFQITTAQSIDAIAARAKAAGAALDLEPVDAMGARVFRLRDPDGFRITVSSPRQS